MRDTAARRREIMLLASVAAAALLAVAGFPGSAERSSEAAPPGTPAPAAPSAKELPGIAIGPPSTAEGTLAPLEYPGERHLRNVRQLTFGGENAEAYWSADADGGQVKRLTTPDGSSTGPPIPPSRPRSSPSGRSSRVISSGPGRSRSAS